MGRPLHKLVRDFSLGGIQTLVDLSGKTKDEVFTDLEEITGEMLPEAALKFEGKGYHSGAVMIAALTVSIVAGSVAIEMVCEADNRAPHRELKDLMDDVERDLR